MSAVAGRCPPCRTVYRWSPGRGRRLAGARCPRCGEELQQTTLGNAHGRRGPGSPVERLEDAAREPAPRLAENARGERAEYHQGEDALEPVW